MTKILIDVGHGGIIQGRYQTPGKRYEGPHKGEPVFLAEGAYNRAIGHGLLASLHLYGIQAHLINPEHEDISLHARARRVNEIARKEKCILLSIHHNAFKDKNVRGTEFFTSIGDTPADPIAEHIAKAFSARFPNQKLRKDVVNPSNYSKDAGYYILESTVCPAVLSEWGFMTNEYDRNRIFDFNTQIEFFTSVIRGMFAINLI